MKKEHEKLEERRATCTNLTKLVDELEAKQKNVRVALSIINRNLSYIFFSNDRFKIDYRNNNYVLLSNGKPVQPSKISQGERNIIGLCYFFASILENQEETTAYTKEYLLLIDDPVSSFDMENKTGIMSFLRYQLGKFLLGNEYTKSIIMTHDLLTYYDSEKMFGELIEASKVKYGGDKPVYKRYELKNKILIPFPHNGRQEYTELMKIVYRFALGDADEYELVIGNINKQRREYVLDEDGNRIKDAKGKDIFNAVSTTGWNDPELLKEWRRAWTEKVNEKFRECHMAARIDHRSYKEQGIDLIPTIHEGYEVRAMEKKGIKTVIGELNRAIRQFNQMFISLKESIQWMKTAYEEMKAELDRRQNPTLLESLQDYYDKKTQGRPPLPNFYAEMKRRGKNLSNLQEFAKSINYLQTHKIETMEDLQERIDELNGVVSVSKKEISEKREQLKKLENLEKMVEVIKTNQPLIDEYNHFFFQKKRDKYYQQHKKEINYYRKCERELKQHLDKNGKVPTARWKREKEELRTTIEELKADNQPYQDELAFVKKVQSCADIARCDREMAETDTSGSSEEKREKQVKFPAFHAAQTEVNLEEKSKVEQQTVNQTEQKPEKKNSIRKQLAEKKKECEERDAKQQTVRKKRNYDMSL